MNLEANKSTVTAFYDLISTSANPTKPSAGWRDLDPAPPNGCRWQGCLIEYFERMAHPYPGKRVEFRRVLAEDHSVVLHAIYSAQRRRLGWVDIFRLDDEGKIVEHWDVLQ